MLTNRVLEVFVLLGQGMSVPEAATFLHRSIPTIERHNTVIGHKLGASTISDISRLVGRTGLTYDDIKLKRYRALRKDAAVRIISVRKV